MNKKTILPLVANTTASTSCCILAQSTTINFQNWPADLGRKRRTNLTLPIAADHFSVDGGQEGRTRPKRPNLLTRPFAAKFIGLTRPFMGDFSFPPQPFMAEFGGLTRPFMVEFALCLFFYFVFSCPIPPTTSSSSSSFEAII